MTFLGVLKSVGVIILGIMLVYEITRNESLEDENGRLIEENRRLLLSFSNKELRRSQERVDEPFEEFGNLKS